MLRFSTVAFLQKNINSIWIIHAPAIFVLCTYFRYYYFLPLILPKKLFWMILENIILYATKNEIPEWFLIHTTKKSLFQFEILNVFFLLPNLGHCNKWDLFGWPSSVHLPNLYQGKFIFYQRSEQKYWLLVLIFLTNLDDIFLKCKTLCGNLKKRSKILSIYLTLFLGSKLSAIVFSEMQMTLNQI